MKKSLISLVLLLLLSICMGTFAVFADNMLISTVEEYGETPAELIIKSDIYRQLDERNTVIDLSDYSLTEAEAEKLLNEVMAENREYINAEITYEYILESEYVKAINVEYEELYASLMASSAIEEEVRNILACVDDTMSDVEKALAVNDYFLLNYCYDLTYSIYTKEGIFANKTGVCAAYASAYEYIMNDKLGIRCITVTSNLMNHAWNLIMIDGEWYHVDVTWNDPIPDMPGRAVHSYFLLSDSAISDAEHNHYGWTGGYEATSTKYDNYFWADVETPIIMAGGYFYYINKDDGTVRKQNISTEEESRIYTINAIWPCWDRPGWHWRGNFSQLVCCEGTLYINTHNKILSMDLNGANIKTLLNHDTSEGYIWGLSINGNRIEYYISRDRWEYGIEKTESFVFRHIAGDVGSDGRVDADDLLLFAKYFAGWNVEIDILSADVTGDGVVNGLDLLRLGKYFSGWNVSLGKQK